MEQKGSDDYKRDALKISIIEYIVLYVGIILISLHMGHAAYGSADTSLFMKEHMANDNYITNLITATTTLVSHPFDVLPYSTYHTKYLAMNSFIYFLFLAVKYVEYERLKSDRDGEGHGTAKWNKNYKGFANKYTFEPKVSENDKDEDCIDMKLIFTSKNKLSFDGRKTRRNTNTVILGGSGTGKSRSYIGPNIAQLNSSYIITDPSGELYQNMYKFLKNNEYDVKVLNLQYPSMGNKYNPFDYITRKEDGSCDESSVMKMVAAFLDNTGSKGAKEDEFWRASAEALFCAAAFYIIETQSYESWTFRNVSKLIRSAKKEASSSSSETPFDAMMQARGKENPNSMAYSFYQTFRLASDKTAESILVSTDVKLSKFAIPEINDLTTTDLVNLDNNINLNTIADKKTALFIITKTGGGPYDFLASMLYNQLFSLLYDKGANVNPYRYHVYSRFGYPLETMFRSKEEATEYIKLITTAQIKEEDLGSNKKVYYLYNSLENIDDKKIEIKVEEKKAKKWLFHLLPKKGSQNETQNNETETFLQDSVNSDTKKRYIMKRIPEMNPDMKKFYPKNQRVKFDTLEAAQKYITKYAGASIRQTEFMLPWAITCLFDEFNNIGEIPQFDETLATCRKYNINISIVLQNLAQLKGRYKDAWNTILGNCDNFLFLGSNELETCKYVSEILGKGTIKEKSVSRGSDMMSKSNYSLKYAARELLTPTELMNMDNSECIYVMRGEMPFKAEKYNIEVHPNYKKTGFGNHDLKTSTEEMKEIYKRVKIKKGKPKTHVLEKQKKESVTPIVTSDDFQDKINAFTEQQAEKKINPKPRRNTPDQAFPADKIQQAKEDEENGIKEEGQSWMF